MATVYRSIAWLLAVSLLAAGSGAQAGAVPRDLSSSSAAATATPTLRSVGTRGFFALDPPFAEFDADHAAVELWTPDTDDPPPVMVYAHGGAGLRADDRARVELFRAHGFATVSFDAYVMNGFDDWEFVTTKVTNLGKQQMIWGVLRGALAYARGAAGWDGERLVLYGGSNGARAALHAGAVLDDVGVRAIIAEAPAGSGFALGDVTTPTLIPFGALDTWAGRSEDDFVWQRTYASSPVSIEDWVNAQQGQGHPVQLVLYEGAGHLFFDGPLERVRVRRGQASSFTAYRGATRQALERYREAVIDFAWQNIGE